MGHPREARASLENVVIGHECGELMVACRAGAWDSPPPAVPLFVFPQIANIDRPHFTLIPFYFKTFPLLRATSMVFTVSFVRRLDGVGGLALRR